MLVKGVTIVRDVPAGRYPLTKLVTGLETSPSLCDLFDGAEGCLAAFERVTIELEDVDGYMWVDNDDGTLFAALPYWRDGDLVGLYLDLCHELVHVEQQWDGLELFDRHYAYVDRPTEVAAYRVTVREARRLGMNDRDLSDFLHVPWITDEEHERLCKHLDVTYTRYVPRRSEHAPK